MMFMKRLLSWILLLTVSVGLLSSCASQPAESTGTDGITESDSRISTGSSGLSDVTDIGTDGTESSVLTDLAPVTDTETAGSTSVAGSQGKTDVAVKKTETSGSAVPKSDSDGAETSSPTTDAEPAATSTKTENTLTAKDVLSASEHLVGICDQKNSRIIVCDLSVEDWSKDEEVVWEYKDTTCKSVAGLKLRYSQYWGETVVLYCYSGGAAIVSYQTKKLLFHTTNAGQNPHSVELLPDGTFIVASSTDSSVRVFSAETVASGGNNYSDAIEFSLAHGVLWDPKYNVLWISGNNQLAAYTVGGTADAPILTPVSGMSYTSPKNSMHDLAPVYGNKDALLVTCAAGILQFDKQKGIFTSSYPGGAVAKSHTYAPGVGNFEQDGVLVFTSISSDTRVENDYSTNIVFIYVPNVGDFGKVLLRNAGNVAFYKVRVWRSDYQ